MRIRPIECRCATPSPSAARRRRAGWKVGRASQSRESIAAASFDDLIRSQQQRPGDCEAKRLGRLEVDHQLELRWLLDGQVRRLCALEDVVDIDSEAMSPEDPDPPHLPRLLCLRGEKAESKPCDGDRHAYDLHLHLRLGQPERPRTYRATCEASSRDARRGRHEKRPWGPGARSTTARGTSASSC